MDSNRRMEKIVLLRKGNTVLTAFHVTADVYKMAHAIFPDLTEDLRSIRIVTAVVIVRVGIEYTV